MILIFAKRLKEVMDDRHLSQSDLARMTGMGRYKINQYLSGKFQPRCSSLKIIADTLNVSADYLMGRIDKTIETISVLEAARMLNMLPQKLRGELKKPSNPYGYAIKRNGRYEYFINPKVFENTKGNENNEKI